MAVSSPVKILEGVLSQAQSKFRKLSRDRRLEFIWNLKTIKLSQMEINWFDSVTESSYLINIIWNWQLIIFKNIGHKCWRESWRENVQLRNYEGPEKVLRLKQTISKPHWIASIQCVSHEGSSIKLHRDWNSMWLKHLSFFDIFSKQKLIFMFPVLFLIVDIVIILS